MKIRVGKKMLWKYVLHCLNNENSCLSNTTKQALNLQFHHILYVNCVSYHFFCFFLFLVNHLTLLTLSCLLCCRVYITKVLFRIFIYSELPWLGHVISIVAFSSKVISISFQLVHLVRCTLLYDMMCCCLWLKGCLDLRWF